MITAILVALIASALLVLIPEGSHGAIFSSDRFDDNLVIEFSPTVPYEYQEVNVTVQSIAGAAIVSANLWVDIRGSEYTASGAYPMDRVNSTARTHTLNGLAANTNVTFWITAYDGVRELESKKHYYDVAAQLSWRHKSFEENLDLMFGPTSPKEGENVTVTIDSREPDVRVRRADINVTVLLPDFAKEQSSAVSMERENDYKFVTDIRDYPGDTVVKFHVTAFDEYWTPLDSREYSYTVEKPPKVFHSGIFVIVSNNITGQYMKAKVSVYNNAGYSAGGSTDNGIFWTPTNMTDGMYTIHVDPAAAEEAEPKTVTVIVDHASSNRKIYINYGLEDVSTGYKIEDFPTTRVLVSFAAVALMFPGLFLLLRDREKKKQRAQLIKGKEDGAGKNWSTGQKGKLKKKKVIRNEEKSLQQRLLVTLEKVHEKMFESVEAKKRIGTAAAFAVLGFFGAFWCPFYPWWMILLITLVTGAIAYGFPYLSLIFISFVAIGSTGYQSPQFGLLFMIFALGVSIASLFNWKFGYLSLLMVFLSTFGLSILVPILALFLFSLYLSITVTVVSGLFMAILTSTGSLLNLSFMASSYATEKDSIVTFSRSPGGSGFTPYMYLDAVSGIRHIDLQTTGSFVQSHMTSMVPIIQIIMWVVIVLAVYFLKRRMEDMPKSRVIFHYSLTAFGILTLSTLGGMFLADFGPEIIFLRWDAVMVYVLALPAILFAVSLCFLLKGLFAEFYADKTGVKVGTRITDLMGFRQTSFEKVGGLTEVKDEIKDSMIGPLLQPEISKKFGVEPPKGMILFGPPGCGKTLLMRVIATELKVEMIGVKCSDIMSKWYGESENLINDLFRIAREKAPCVLFLDEIDAIAKRRDFYSADDVTPRLLSIMLSEMDGMDEFAEIIIIGATNKPELVDPALLRPGRFDKVIYVPPPDLPSRLEILKIHLKGKPTSKDIDLKVAAGLTKGYSGADVANLCRECATNAMRRHLKTGQKTKIGMKDFRDITDILKPSLSREMLDEYEQLQLSFERKLKRGSVRSENCDDGKVEKSEGDENETRERGRARVYEDDDEGEEFDDGDDEDDEGWEEENDDEGGMWPEDREYDDNGRQRSRDHHDGGWKEESKRRGGRRPGDRGKREGTGRSRDRGKRKGGRREGDRGTRRGGSREGDRGTRRGGRRAGERGGVGGRRKREGPGDRGNGRGPVFGDRLRWD